jgi:hypothetical protein
MVPTGRLHDLDPTAGPIEPAGSPLADALQALGREAAAASRRLGPRPARDAAVAITGGMTAFPARRAGVRQELGQRTGHHVGAVAVL